MTPNQDKNHDSIRPTKKQKVLLAFIADFIAQHGYSPSYREIMAGLNYTSVATVSLHVNSLIKRGQLIKRGHSARSLELVAGVDTVVLSNIIAPDQERWLIEKVEHAFRETEQSFEHTPQQLENLQVLVSALRVLGLEAASLSYLPRLKQLKP